MSFAPCSNSHKFIVALPTTHIATTMTKIKLTYFDIEGAAEPVRLALALAGKEYEDDRVKFPDWKELKPKTPYGQLPVMTIDDDPTMKTQSSAMLRWVGKTFSDTLYPDDKLFDIEEAIGLVEDFKRAWNPNLYIGMRAESFGHPEGFSKTDEGKELVKKMRTTFVKEELPKWLGFLEGWLNRTDDGSKFLVGSEPTIADCQLIPVLRSLTRGHVDHVDTKCLESNPKIVSYVKRFCDLPSIKGRYENGIGSAAY